MLRSDNSLKVNHKQADPCPRYSIDPTSKLDRSTPSKEVSATLLRRNHPLRASVLASVAGDLMTIEVHYSLLLDLCDLKTSPFRE